jgi:hypothetical protein
VGIRCADHVTPSTRKSRHYFADSSGRSVGIVRLRTKATEFFLVGGGVQLGPLGTAATYRPIESAPGDYDGEIGGMVIGRGNLSTRRKPASVPLCSPQTHMPARTRTRAAAVGRQRLNA